MTKGFSFSSAALAAWLTVSLYVYLQGRSNGKINIFLLFQLFFGMLLILLPDVLQLLFSVSFPKTTYEFYQLFLILAVFLGTGLNFVNKIPYWDKGLHILCGVLFSLLGYSLLTLFIKRQEPSLWLFLLFGLCFSLAIGVLWEFWEFFCDTFLGMNLQQFDGSGRVPKMGQEALLDTMIDLLADFLGALIAAVLLFIRYS